MAELLRKRGLVVFVSDLLAPVETLETNLALLTAAGHEVILFQLLDPAELAFTFDDAGRFLDLESGRDLFLEPELARKDYCAPARGLTSPASRAVCSRLGISFHRLATDQPLELALFDFLKARAARGERRSCAGKVWPEPTIRAGATRGGRAITAGTSASDHDDDQTHSGISDGHAVPPHSCSS
jgi:hypothetical protein